MNKEIKPGLRLRKIKQSLRLIYIILFSLMYFLFAGKAFAATYYVSSSLGNDSNNGTSTSTPWKTLGKVDRVFSAGDNILFKKGDS